MSGEGPMAAMMAKMGNHVDRPQTVQSVDTGAARRRPVRGSGRLQDQGTKVRACRPILSQLRREPTSVDCRRAPSAAGGARVGRRHGRVDRHLPRDSLADAPRRARHGDRQRRRRAGRKQPASPGRTTSATPSAGDQIIPFLTTKHSLEFCLAYADQTVQNGFPSLVVLGGDKHVGRPRCARARVAAAAADSRAPPGTRAGRMGESDRRPAAARSTSCWIRTSAPIFT